MYGLLLETKIRIMKKILLTVILAASIIFGAAAQNKLDDNTLAIAVEKPSGIENENASIQVENNLKQALVLNGLSATESRFTTVTNAALLSKKVTATAPAKYITELEVSIFIVDLYTGVMFGQTSFNVKGVGNNEGESYIDATQKINSRNPKLRTMIRGAKESIAEYFNSHSEEIMGRIDAYMKAEDYRSAAIEIYAIPMICRDLYNMASERIAYIPADVLSKINFEIISGHFYKGSKEDRIKNILK